MKKDKNKISRSILKQQAILNAAKKIFLKQGYKGVNMDDVANKAMVSKKTIYHHFNNKENLFREVLIDHWNKLIADSGELFSKKQAIDTNLKKFSHNFLNFLYQQDTIDLFKLLIGESKQLSDLIDQILIAGKPPFTRALINFLDENVKKGKLKINDVERAAAYFMGLLKEYHFWPMMLGFTKKKKFLNKDILVTDAVAMFLSFYQVD